MENNRITQDFLKQLKRIADALEKTNLLEEKKLKKSEKLEKIQEKKAREELKSLLEKRNVEKVTRIINSKLDSDN